MLCSCVFVFFFFKQKTAYERRISDWSSDVCSSDLKCPCSHAALHNRQNIGTLATNTLGSAGQCAREPGSSMIRPIANALLRDVRQRAEAKHLRAVASRCDAFLTSYPKCGRTWLRYLLSHYLAETVGLGFQPDLVSTFRILPNF